MKLIVFQKILKIAKLSCLIVCLFPYQSIDAQVVNFADIVPEEGTRAKSFEDYLVQIAWQNNQRKRSLGVEKEVADERVKLAQKQWLRSLQFNASMSPRDKTVLFQLSPTVQAANAGEVIPPFLNFGLGYSIGDALTQKNEVRIKKKEVEIFEFKINEERLVVRNRILTAYQQYLSSIEIYNARKKAEDDAESTYYLLSEKFKKDKASFEEYNNASSAYHNSVEKRLQASSEIQLARIDMEELLGVRWEAVERNKSKYSKKGRSTKKKN